MAAVGSSTISFIFNLSSQNPSSLNPLLPSFISNSSFPSFKSLKLNSNTLFLSTTIAASSPSTASSSATAPTTFHGECYVVGDNIDTDQIIPAEYLTLIPSNHALIGLPSSYQTYPVSTPLWLWVLPERRLWWRSRTRGFSLGIFWLQGRFIRWSPKGGCARSAGLEMLLLSS